MINFYEIIINMDIHIKAKVHIYLLCLYQNFHCPLTFQNCTFNSYLLSKNISFECECEANKSK